MARPRVSPSDRQLSLFDPVPFQMPLPPYHLRKSARAQRVTLKISLKGELEVVVPVGFDLEQIPAILQERQQWIHRTQNRLAQQRASYGSKPATPFPTSLALRSRHQTWAIHYTDPDHGPSLTQSGPQTLTLGGASETEPQVHLSLLRDWLRRRAQVELAPWLQELSQRCGLGYSRLTIRGQARCWGSCSSQRAISLNFKLLFLPLPLVEYVLIHELCHTVHMNHSSAFWALVERHCPTWKRQRTDLKQGGQYLPSWLEG